MAAAYPYFDQGPDERAARLRDQFLGWDYGRWVYVRHIDGWWCEGQTGPASLSGDRTRQGRRRIPGQERGNRHHLRAAEVPPDLGHRHMVAGLAPVRVGGKLQEAQTWRDGWNLAE